MIQYHLKAYSNVYKPNPYEYHLFYFEDAKHYAKFELGVLACADRVELCCEIKTEQDTNISRVYTATKLEDIDEWEEL